jgi:hypothetical protein
MGYSACWELNHGNYPCSIMYLWHYLLSIYAHVRDYFCKHLISVFRSVNTAELLHTVLIKFSDTVTLQKNWVFYDETNTARDSEEAA